jgi:hypothetical protein
MVPERALLDGSNQRRLDLPGCGLQERVPGNLVHVHRQSQLCTGIIARFGFSPQSGPFCETRPGEQKDRVALSDVLAAIHRLLRAELEGAGAPVTNPCLNREHGHDLSSRDAGVAGASAPPTNISRVRRTGAPRVEAVAVAAEPDRSRQPGPSIRPDS